MSLKRLLRNHNHLYKIFSSHRQSFAKRPLPLDSKTVHSFARTRKKTRKFLEDLGVSSSPGYTFAVRMWAEWCYMTCIKMVKRTFIPSKYILEPCLNAQSSLPLSLRPDGVVSFLLGKFPAKIGDRPTKTFGPTPAALFISCALQKFCKLDFNVCFSSVCTGSFLTNLPYFQNMFRHNPTSNPVSEEEWEKIFTLFHKKVPLPALDRPVFRNVYGLEIKPNTFPGAREKYFCGFNNKLQALSSDLKVLRQVWFTVASGISFAENIWTIGAREKREEDARSGEIKTRGVLMPEGWYALFESLYSRPIEITIHGIKTSSFYLGHSMCHWGWTRYFKDICGRGMAFEGDFKGFDTTVSEELMIRAFCLLRACYPDSPIVDNHFMFIMKNFIYKNILTPGGLLYRCNKGLPSGTSFTSLLGTTVNILVLLDIFLHYPSFAKMNLDVSTFNFCVCGDDFVVSLPRQGKVEHKIFNLIGKTFDEVEFDDWLLSRHGMKIKKPGLKYGDAASVETLFGRIWRFFHCDKNLVFPTPVFFFEGKESFVNEFPLTKVPDGKADFSTPLISTKFSRKERRQMIYDSISPETLESLEGTNSPDLASVNEMLSVELGNFKEGEGLREHGNVFNYFGLTSNYWLLLRSYFIASDKCASFLKTIIWKGRPSVSFTDMYWRILMPISRVSNSWDVYNFIRSVYVTFPLLDFHNAWLLTYFIAVSEGTNLSEQNVEKEFCNRATINNYHYYSVFMGTDPNGILTTYTDKEKSLVKCIVSVKDPLPTKVIFQKFSLTPYVKCVRVGTKAFTMYAFSEFIRLYGYYRD